MSNNDRSNEALLGRRAKAEAATPGPWEDLSHHPDHIYGAVNCGEKHIALCNVYDIPDNPARVTHKEQLANAAHIAANDPGTAIEDINEILRLRNLVKEHEEYIANLELETQAYDKKIGEIAAILGITPDAGDMRIPGYIKDEILRLQAENARIEREVDYLASTICSFHSCFDCPFYSLESGNCIYHEKPWRQQARKAAEEQCKK